VGVGFIGCGRVSDNHFRALSRCRSAALVAVSGGRIEHITAKANSWGVTPVETPEQLVALDAIDAVFVLTPTESHFAYAEMAMRHGKHVLVEKPVSYELEEIAELEKLAGRYGVLCVPGHSYLYLPEISRMMRYTREGGIGVPFYFFMSEIYRMPEEYLSKYHGPLREVLCHEIYILLALLGAPRRVHGFASAFRRMPQGSEEQVVLNAEFADGALAHLFVSWAGEDETSDPWTFTIKVLGRDGGLHFSRRDAVRGTSGGGSSRDYPLYDAMFEGEVRHFVEECLLGGREPLSSLRDAYRTLQVMRAVEESIERNVTVELPEGTR
jgi:predicted dehydrogenase